jgi:hypothetical protein
MNNIERNKLEIHGKSELNRVAKEVLTDLLPQLQKYVGIKIATQKGFSSKFVYKINEPKVKPLENGHFASSQNSYLNFTQYDLKLRVKICLNGGKYEDKTYYCQYFDFTYYIGKMEDSKLISLNSLDSLINDYYLNETIDLDEQNKLIEQYKAMKNQLKTLKDKIKIPFSDY